MKFRKNLTLAMVIAAMGSSWARAEFINSFEPLPPSTWTSGATSFSMVFQGNVLSSLDTMQTQNDPFLNPYLYVNENYFNGTGTTSVTATLDGNGNTVVTWTGSNPVVSSDSFNYGGFGNSEPHFGLDPTTASAPVGQSLNVLSPYWSNGTLTMTLPGLSASLANGGITPTSDPFAIIFADVTSDGNTVGTWFELPYTSSSPMVTLTNYTSSAETLSDVGYFLSPTEIPLDQLNYGHEPPPGTNGSPFTPLPGLDGTTLSGGNGIGGAGAASPRGRYPSHRASSHWPRDC